MKEGDSRDTQYAASFLIVLQHIGVDFHPGQGKLCESLSERDVGGMKKAVITPTRDKRVAT